MKWFKHHSDASLNDKIGRLEDQAGLIGYAAYFKILEICASNWDEVSDPIFTLSLKQIQNKLRMKSKQTDFILGLLSELNLFQITKSENEVIIVADNMAKIKKRFQKTTNSQPTNDTPIKNKSKNKDTDKEKEAEKEDSSIPKDIFQIIKTNYQYSDEIIEEVRKDAWLKYSASDDPKKDWRRFIANYFKFEKDKIRNKLIESAKPSKKEKMAVVDELISRVINNSHLQAHEFQRLFEETELELVRSVGGSRAIVNASPFDLKQIKNELALKDLGGV